MRTSIALALFVASAPLSAQITPGPTVPPQPDGISWNYFALNVPGSAASLTVETELLFGNDVDLYLRYGRKPDETHYDFRSAQPANGDESVTVSTSTRPQIQNGTWWAGVRRPQNVNFDIAWSYGSQPSAHPGMGANLYQDPGQRTGGVSFRVWAPFATGVWVAGDFNGWSSTLSPLSPEGDGNWSVDVRELGADARYRYVINGPAGPVWRNDPRARRVTNSTGDSVVVDPSDYDWGAGGFQMPPWNELVLYEMHVGTLEDEVGGGPGTFASAIERLDDIADLGVTALLVMPVGEFAGDFSWGYNTGHPFAVESAYGGDVGFRDFIRAAHERGLAVLLDVLYNHWGPTDLSMWQFDGWNENGWGGIYFYNNGQAVTPWGDTRPDFGRPEVRSYIRDNALFWLNEYQLDGLRWDSTSNIRKGPWGDIPEGWSLMQWANDEIDGSQPWKISIAEDMFDAPNDYITKDTGAGGAGFDSQWDALFVHPVRAAMETPSDADRDMWAVRNAISHYYNGDAFERVIYTESHDEVANGNSRVPEEIWPGNASSWFSKKRSTLGALVTLTSPGIPMLFQGQEILEDGYFHDDDPVDWSKASTFAGIRLMYRDMIRLRRNWFDTTRGLRGNNTNVHHVNNGDKVIAFHRWDQGGARDDVIVLCNFANQTWGDYRIGLPQPGTWRVRFNSDWDGYDASFGSHPTVDVVADNTPWDGMPYSASLSFGPYTGIVLSQE